jgi:hypothetical protein
VPDRCLIQRNGVLLQFIEKCLPKAGCVVEKSRLASVAFINEHRHVDYVLINNELRAMSLGMEAETAATDTLGLFPHGTIGSTTGGKVETLQEPTETSAEFDISAAGAKRLGLQVD